MSARKPNRQHSPAGQRRHSICPEEHISLDERLLYDARARTNGANVHQMKGLIFEYELAVSLHNDGSLAHKTTVYDPTCEIELRKAVLKSRMEEFHSRFAIAARNAYEILRFLDSRGGEESKVVVKI